LEIELPYSTDQCQKNYYQSACNSSATIHIYIVAMNVIDAKLTCMHRIIDVFFASVRYMVIKSMYFCFKLVLQTIKHTIIYLGCNRHTSSGSILKMNIGYNWVSIEI
jgi:hypothetical protein